MNFLTNNYTPLDVSFYKGKGLYLYDKNNNKYLDALSGVGVNSLGHSHPKIVKSIKKQASKLIHTSNWYHIEHQEKLAKKLCDLANMDKVFFANSGAEANEAAIKLSRLYAHKKNISNPIIITVNKSFHGRTMATLSATGNPKIQNGFAPLLPGFINVNYNNITDIKNLENNKNIVAIMLEPILGESGVIIPDDDYLNEIRKICDKNSWLMILDEIQTGIGRTGKMFAHQYNNITPDIMTLAKGLANGVPIGACIARGIAADFFSPGSHGSTFGGNPLATKTALKVLKIIKKENILANCQKYSDYLLKEFQDKLKNVNYIKEIRVKGLMIGIELEEPCTNLLQQALRDKILINITNNTIRLLPPLIITKVEAEIIVKKVVNLIKKL